LQEISKQKPNEKNRVDPEVEKAVVDFAAGTGPRRVRSAQ
jgi:hypothetical protein